MTIVLTTFDNYVNKITILGLFIFYGFSFFFLNPLLDKGSINKMLSNEINYQIKRYAKNEEVASFDLMNKGDPL